jgi:hypothetical protein
MKHHATLIRHAKPLEYQFEETGTTLTFSYDRIGVAEVKLIVASAQLRPTIGVEQTFVIQTLFVTHEAQNALLKLFEEPPVGLVFVLVLPPAVKLLPTLLSRIGKEIPATPTESTNQIWDEFFQASPADRLAQIDAWQKTKEPQWLQSIITGVHNIKSSDVPTTTLSAVQLVGERLATRGASNKMLLEHLALILPLRK